MKVGQHTTPVLLRTPDGFRWPEGERVFYVLASDGLHICRDHEFFRSSVPARGGPGDLERQGTFLTPRFPVVPRELFERVVGFFGRVGEEHGGEAAVMLFWDRAEERVRVVVPEQTATVKRYRDGYRSPIGLLYEPPTDVPAAWVRFGDVHSHVHLSAYCSHADQEDEVHDAGLHVVIGRIDRDPPDIHVEAVVDGVRFELEPSTVIEGYEARDLDVPAEWLGKVVVETSSSSWGRIVEAPSWTTYQASERSWAGWEDGWSAPR